MMRWSMEFFGPGRLGSGFLIMEYEGYGVPSRVEGKRVGKMCEVIRTEDEISSSRRSKEGSDACEKLCADRERSGARLVVEWVEKDRRGEEVGNW